jgi:hypothetical protein
MIISIPILSIILWFISGIIGYLIICYAYCLLNPPNKKEYILKNLIAIILGPVAIIVGLLFLWDLFCEWYYKK